MATINNGVLLTPLESYNKSYYSPYGSVWSFSGNSFPQLVPAERLSYPGMTGLNYDAIDAYNIIRYGISESLEGMKFSLLGTTAWDLSILPPALIDVPKLWYDTSIKPIDYSYWAVLERLLYGSPITLEDSQLSYPYSTNGYDMASTWYYNERDKVVTPSLKWNSPYYDTAPNPIDYAPINAYNQIRDGGAIDQYDSVDIIPYIAQGFSFSKVWGIQLGLEPPTLLNWKKHTPVSDPMSSTSWEVLMGIDGSGVGSMYYDGAIWSPDYTSKHIEVKGGIPGAQVVHELPKEITKIANDEVDMEYYVYIGAGAENVDNPSGYEPPQQVTSVTSIIDATRSSDVAFYYNKLYAPTYDYLIKVSSDNPDVPYHLIVTQSDPSSIKLRLSDRKYGWFRLVPVGDPFSSPVRVRTHAGVFSIQSPDVNEDLFKTINNNSKPSVAFITKEVNAPENEELILSMTKLGYNVVLISDTTANSKKFDGFTKYDIIMLGRTTSNTYANAIDYSKKPVIIGYAVEKAISLQTELGMTEAEPYHTEQVVPSTQKVMNNNHYITRPFGVGETFNPYKSLGDNFVGVIDNRRNEILGQPLIMSTNHPLRGDAVSLSVRTMPSGQRRVYMGFLYRDFSPDTQLLLGRAVEWVMGLD